LAQFFHVSIYYAVIDFHRIKKIDSKINRKTLMNFLNKITEPALLFDKRKCLMNIRRMKQKADKNNVQFRPHFKTHQSVEI